MKRILDPARRERERLLTLERRALAQYLGGLAATAPAGRCRWRRRNCWRPPP